MLSHRSALIKTIQLIQQIAHITNSAVLIPKLKILFFDNIMKK